MELVYVWVESYRNIQQEGFQFSDDYHIQYDKDYRKLNISKKEAKLTLFNNKVENITAIIGKNGTGKTNILDLLGAKRDGRLNLGDHKEVKYFILYHFDNNRFIVEGSNFALIKNSIVSYPKGKGLYNHLKEPYSIIIEQENNEFIYKGLLQMDLEGRESKNEIHYFNFRHQFAGPAYQPLRSLVVENEYTHFFNRVNLSRKNTGKFAIFNMIVELNKNKSGSKQRSKLFDFNQTVNMKISVEMFKDVELKLQIEKGFNNQLFYLESKYSSQDTRRDFINKLLHDYCISLASHLLSISKLANKKDFIQQIVRKVTLEDQNFKDYYYKIIQQLLMVFEKNEKHFILTHEIISILKEYIKQLEQFNPEWFYKNYIEIPVGIQKSPPVNELLQLIDKLEFMDEELQTLIRIFSVDFSPLSSGEEALLSLFAALHYGITLNYNRPKKKAIILLDEPDNFLHPEWCRLMIYELVNFLNRINDGYLSYHLIISTHSPFIISDIPLDHVIALKKDSDSGLCKKTILEEETFAANIHTLFAHEFFMKSTIGEFAKQQINKVIYTLDNSQDLSLEQINEVDAIISFIGEPLLKGKLKLMANKAFRKEEQIKRLKAQLMELENDDLNKES